MMDTAFIYHWWGEPSDPDPINNLRSPIIASIGTLRGVNKEIPIYVLDLSENETNWGSLPELLNFHFFRIHPYLEKYTKKDGYKYLSRLFDVRRFTQNHKCENWIYCDTDVFWLKDPLPLGKDTNKFCFDKYNTGFFYFNNKSSIIDELFQLFESITLSCLYDENYWYIVRQYGYINKTHYLPDEAVMFYLCSKFPQFFNIIDFEEHFTMWKYDQYYPDCDLSKIKMIHSNGLMVDNPMYGDIDSQEHSRGLLVLAIKELYYNLYLANENLSQSMFSNLEHQMLLGKEIIFDHKSLQSIRNTCKDKHYFLKEALKYGELPLP